jgi:hypothetical protein
MSQLAHPRRAAETRAAGCWVAFYAVTRLYVDLALVASATCRPACAR